MLISHFMDSDMQQHRSEIEGSRFNKFQFYYYESFGLWERTWERFKGVPFQDPKPPVAFSNEIYDATYERSGCFEFNAAAKGIVGSDDCLFLNIYTKNVKPKKLRPVMVYIHGGAFLSVSWAVMEKYQIFNQKKREKIYNFRVQAAPTRTVPISCSWQMSLLWQLIIG